MAMDRRTFLRGASACAIAAVVPVSAAPVDYRMWLMAEEEQWRELALAASPSFQRAPIFEGCVAVYNGVIIRQIDMLGEV